MVKETAEERIIRARVQITYSNPFFAYLSLYLTIEEDKIGRIPKDAGMSVSPTGHVYYRKEFVDSITDAQLIGCLKHEICHLFLLHLIRVGIRDRDRYKFNIATDIVVNTMLLKNKVELPRGLKPNDKNEFIIMGKIIKNIDSKSADEVYEELLNINIPEEKKSQVYVTFDEHMDGDEKGGKEQVLTEPELQELETEWFNRGKTAIVLAQQKGNLPLGMERYVDKLKKVEINWKVALRRFIQQTIAIDYTFMKRSNRGISLGIYLPGVKKEKINIVASVDTSGSIEEPELTRYLSEIIGIAKTFREVIDMRIMFHDEEVQADYMVKNGSIPQIMAMKPKGGGGTSHKHLLNTIKKEVRDCKCLVSFTDGYSDIQDIKLRDYKFPKLFIINKKGTIPKVKKGDATFIRLRNE